MLDYPYPCSVATVSREMQSLHIVCEPVSLWGFSHQNVQEPYSFPVEYDLVIDNSDSNRENALKSSSAGEAKQMPIDKTPLDLVRRLANEWNDIIQPYIAEINQLLEELPQEREDPISDATKTVLGQINEKLHALDTFIWDFYLKQHKTAMSIEGNRHILVDATTYKFPVRFK